MDKKAISYIVLLIILVGAIIGGLWFADKSEAPKRAAYAKLAQCLNDNGALFYGAFWCPACAQQKTIFGSAVNKLPYEECSTPDRKAQIQVCVDEEIQSYPTWKFADGKRCGGVISAEVLAHLSSCESPVYDGQESDNSVGSLYVRLVEEPLEKRLRQSNTSEEETEKELERVRNIISVTMDAKHGTKLEETENVDHLLDVVSQVIHGCVIETPAENEELSDEFNEADAAAAAESAESAAEESDGTEENDGE